MAIECLASPCALQKPPPGAVLAPYVKLVMKSSGVEISVGNESAPQNGNHAVIRSFEFGYTERPIARVVIHDEAGSSFVKFMENLLKDLKCFTPESAINNEVEVMFGWINTSCSGSFGFQKSTSHHMIIRHVICNFDGGKLMYELELTDLMDSHAEARIDKIYGEDGDKGLYMKDAIIELLRDTDYPPAVNQVEFLKLNSDGKGTEPIVFKYTDGKDKTKGRRGAWEANNRDKLNVVMDWLSQNVSTDGKSFIVTYDSTVTGGKVIVWEDPKPKCGEAASQSCIGHYIVNGGKDSRVISFNPRFKFIFVNLASSGGSMGSGNVNAHKDSQSKNPGHDCDSLTRERIASGGAQNTTSASRNTQNSDKSIAEDIEAETKNQQLMAYFDAASSEPIEADLVIVGDPSLPTPLLNKFRPISISFINPYHLFPQVNGYACGDWLAAPFCNEVLTNRRWLVKGVTHNIEAGKFTTTINVMLPAPGVHLNVGEPFGGSGSGGWSPPAQC